VVGVNVICWAILELRKSFVNQVDWVIFEPYHRS
jgi:hypothetical protein